MAEEIRIMVKDVGKPVEVRTVSNDYNTFNKLVGGYLETLWCGMGVLAVFNEEGRRLGLPQNENVNGYALLGTVFFCGVDGEGDLASLSFDQETFVKERLYANHGNKVHRD